MRELTKPLVDRKISFTPWPLLNTRSKNRYALSARSALMAGS
jgi:hypothetical protein